MKDILLLAWRTIWVVLKVLFIKKLYQLNMPMRARYSQISDDELRTKIIEIHQIHPNTGHMV